MWKGRVVQRGAPPPPHTHTRLGVSHCGGQSQPGRWARPLNLSSAKHCGRSAFRNAVLFKRRRSPGCCVGVLVAALYRSALCRLLLAATCPLKARATAAKRVCSCRDAAEWHAAAGGWGGK